MLEEDLNLIASNMATTTTDLLISRLLPEKFHKGDDLENFIKDCQRFFGATKTTIRMQVILTTTLLDRSLMEDYEAAEGKTMEEKLRYAFSKPTSLMDDLKEALSYEQGSDSAETFIEKIKKMTKKLIAHKWDEEEIEKCLLTNCVRDREVKKEIEMKDLKTSEEIKATIKKLEKVNKIMGHINVVKTSPVVQNYRSYRDVAQRGMVNGNNNFKQRNVSNRQLECWTCKKTGHVSRECQMKKKMTCFACGVEGHVRRECSTIQCQRCHLRGHKEIDCYTNLERRKFQTNSNMRNNNYYAHRTTSYQQKINNPGRTIAAIEANDETMPLEYSDDAEDKYEDIQHPKVHASTREAMIGAIY